MLRQRFGKSGVQLHAYANGYDPAPVHRVEDLPPPKSIGNSATAPRDLICEAVRARRCCRFPRAWVRVCGWRGISAARWS